MKRKILIYLAVVLIIGTRTLAQNASEPTRISIETAQSLLVYQIGDSGLIGSGTAFIAEVKGNYYLITNWHVVTNREFYWSGTPLKKGGAPTKLEVIFQGKVLGDFTHAFIPLYKGKKQKWIDLMFNNKITDVVAIPIPKYPNAQYYTVFNDTLIDPNREPVVSVMTDVFIVGFPHGESSFESWGLYKRGTVASEPELNLGDLPVFAIDATTKAGMSGSPVYFHSPNGYLTKGGAMMMGSGITRFIGVYGAQKPDIEIGIVWKRDFIIDALIKAVK